MKIKCATISKTGKRSNNEDAFSVWNSPDEIRWMGIVCDGLGGHAMGEVASETVTHAIAEYWTQHTAQDDDQGKVVKACKKASCALDQRAEQFHHCEMGTTMVMASIVNNIATIAHVGDSRCYVLRSQNEDCNRKYEKIYQTKDHVRTDFGWEVVSRCFFSYQGEKAVPEIHQLEVQPGDRLLLCSDGVYKSIPPEILTDCLMDDRSPEQIIDVIDFLCEKNGDDNYTAILAIMEE